MRARLELVILMLVGLQAGSPTVAQAARHLPASSSAAKTHSRHVLPTAHIDFRVFVKEKQSGYQDSFWVYSFKPYRRLYPCGTIADLSVPHDCVLVDHSNRLIDGMLITY